MHQPKWPGDYLTNVYLNTCDRFSFEFQLTNHKTFEIEPFDSTANGCTIRKMKCIRIDKRNNNWTTQKTTSFVYCSVYLI